MSMFPIIGALQQQQAGSGEAPPYSFVANVSLRRSANYDAPASNTAIPWDSIIEDTTSTFVSGNTDIVAPAGALWASISAMTRDNGTGATYHAMQILQNSINIGETSDHGGDYSTSAVARIVPCLAGDTFRIMFSPNNTSSDLQQDCSFGVIFYG